MPRSATALSMWLCVGLALAAQEPSLDSDRIKNLTDLSLEELMSVKVKVTSASRREEKLTQAPAAIFVMTGEDIRRGGFSSLPEALRMVPGLYVAKVNSHWWTISARGFNDYLNNKMLVLVDGRSVYTPHFGGVFWELQDMPLEIIDRIEVIRGPGGTLWGANAVNGVINIISKSSEQTQGFSVNTSAAQNDGYTTSIGYGDRVGPLTYRIFGKAAYWEPGFQASGAHAYDFSNLSRGGLRIDTRLSNKDELSFESGMYDGRLQADIPFFSEPGTPQTRLRSSYVVRGGYLQSRWTRRFASGSAGSLLGYCDWSDRLDVIDEVRSTCHVEWQHDFRIRARHALVWGVSGDTSGASLYQSFTVRGIPPDTRFTTAGLFTEYQFEFIPDRLRLSAGTKLEHNTYSGFNMQPQVRAVWTPSRTHTLWGAVSRSVRVASGEYVTAEVKFTSLPGRIPTYLTAQGNPGLKPESLKAYELGYRFNPIPAFSLDTAIFYNRYEDLINLNLLNPLGVAGPPRVHTNPLYAEVVLPWQNLGPGQTHGLEAYAKFQPVSRWMVAAGVTELRGNSVNFNDSLNLPVANSPRHQFNIQSRLNLTSRIDIDAALYHENGIAGYVFGGVVFQDVPTHNRVDAGISVRAARSVTVSLWGRDLGARRHWENRPPLFTTEGSQVPGQVIALKLLWRSPTAADRRNSISDGS